MILTLFSLLLGIAILGLIFGYVYLLGEQNKLFPKNKYDQAQDEIYKRRHPQLKRVATAVGTSLETTIGKTLRALLLSNFPLLLITFGIAMAISILPVSMIAFNPSEGIGAWVWIVVMLSLSPLFIPFFPAGLMVVIANITQADSNFFSFLTIGWLIYFVILLLGSFTKNRSVFIFIYLIFVALLIMNIIGCVQDASPFLVYEAKFLLS